MQKQKSSDIKMLERVCVRFYISGRWGKTKNFICTQFCSFILFRHTLIAFANVNKL